MHSDEFRNIEKREDDILNRLDEINKEINDIIRATTGLSSEFKELLIERIIKTLSSVNYTNTWHRE